MQKPVVLAADVVASRLKSELPAWSLKDGRLHRVYRTGGWRVSLMIANAIGHLAETAWHHPDLLVTYPSVTVTLTTHDAGGISDLDFALAARIEALIAWDPKAEGSSLPGLPSDPALAYLKLS